MHLGLHAASSGCERFYSPHKCLRLKKAAGDRLVVRQRSVFIWVSTVVATAA